MREIRTSGSMSGLGKPGGYAAAPQLDSTPFFFRDSRYEKVDP